MSDFFFDIFLYFRLGNQIHHPNGKCLYLKLGESNVTPEVLEIEQLPTLTSESFRICAISDTHERHHCITASIPPCDILLHTGDIMMTNRMRTSSGSVQKLVEFNQWLGSITQAKEKIIIGGNHDLILQQLPITQIREYLSNANYLCNNSINFGGFLFFGTPASRGESGNRAFQSREFRQETKSTIDQLLESQNPDENIKNKIDFLLTHDDGVAIANQIQPNIAHFWGHFHGAHGVQYLSRGGQEALDSGYLGGWWSICSSIMCGGYTPRQLPVVLEIPARLKKEK